MSYSAKGLGSWFRFIRNKVGFLDIYDIGILKICVLSVGLLIGAFNSKIIKKFAPVFAFFGAIGTIYLFIKIFLKDSVL